MILVTTDPNMQIVRNNLIFWLEARFKTSAVQSGATWYDISGNGRNITLANTPTFNTSNGGSYVFNGTTQYGSTTFPFLSGDFTLNVWVYNSLAYSGIGPYHSFLSRGAVFENNTNFSMGIRPQTSNYAFFCYWRNGASIFGTEIVLSTTVNNVWSYLSFKRNGTNFSYYENGSLLTTISRTAPTSDGGQALKIAAPNTTTSADKYMPCRIGAVQIYDIALTDAEIAHNYKVQKKRFGL
jgi:hypothetical protein